MFIAMINAIIIEDEKLNSDLLVSMLHDFVPEVQIVAVCRNVLDAFNEIKARRKEQLLLFLDIELGGSENGFDLLKIIEKEDIDVIVTSAFPNYAIQAFRNRTVDFLVKPIRISELVEAVSRVSEKYSKKEVDSQPANANELLVQLHNRIVYIQLTEIVYIKSLTNKSELYLKDGSVVNALDRIGELEAKIQSGNFFRTHQSYIANLNYVTAIIKDEDTTQLELFKHYTIPIARRQKAALLKQIKLR